MLGLFVYLKTRNVRYAKLTRLRETNENQQLISFMGFLMFAKIILNLKHNIFIIVFDTFERYIHFK